MSGGLNHRLEGYVDIKPRLNEADLAAEETRNYLVEAFKASI